MGGQGKVQDASLSEQTQLCPLWLLVLGVALNWGEESGQEETLRGQQPFLLCREIFQHFDPQSRCRRVSSGLTPLILSVCAGTGVGGGRIRPQKQLISKPSQLHLRGQCPPSRSQASLETKLGLAHLLYTFSIFVSNVHKVLNLLLFFKLLPESACSHQRERS